MKLSALIVLLFSFLVKVIFAKGLLEHLKNEGMMADQAVCSQLMFTFYNSNPGTDISLVCLAYGQRTVSLPVGGNGAVINAIVTYLNSCGLAYAWVSSINPFACVYLAYPLTTRFTTNCSVLLPIVCSKAGPNASTFISTTITGTSITLTSTILVNSTSTSSVTQTSSTIQTVTNLSSTLLSTTSIVTNTSSVTRDTTSTVPVVETITISSTETFTFTETIYANTASVYTSTRTRSTSSTVTTLTTLLTTFSSTYTSSSCPITQTLTSTEQSTVRVTVVNIFPVFTTVTFTAETRINCC